MRARLLTFAWRGSDREAGRFEDLLNHLNSHPWKGYPALTCQLVDLDIEGPAGGQHAGVLTVAHRACGWAVRRLDRDGGGRLLDGAGGALPAGREAVVLSWDVLPRADFNLIDFGRLLGGDGGQRP